MATEIDTINDMLVSTNGKTFGLLNPKVMTGMTKEQAIRAAAWLAVMADPLGDEFDKVREAVKNT